MNDKLVYYVPVWVDDEEQDDVAAVQELMEVLSALGIRKPCGHMTDPEAEDQTEKGDEK